ncbi:MAG: redoxin domain-containing protein, partial [Chlorobi bacterium]|nr:redoxin domain-containing protein [Chlorobiota bacterium]
MLNRLFFTLMTSFLILTSCAEKQEVNTIHGTLLSCEGKPMQAADIKVYIFSSGIDTVNIKPDSDGKFDLIFADAEKITLNFHGADHISYTLPLFTNGIDESFDLVVKLQAYILADDLTDVRVFGNFNEYDFHSSVQMMPDSKGIYHALVPNSKDTLSYQLLGIVGGGEERSVNGTTQDLLIFDGEGDYCSAIVTSEKEVNIIFDPAKKKYPLTELSVTSSDEQINSYIEKYSSRIKKNKQNFKELDQAIADRDTNKIESIFDKILSETEALILDEKNEAALSDLLMSYCELYSIAYRHGIVRDHAAKIKTMIPKVLPASSAVWLDAKRMTAYAALIIGGEEAVNFLRELPKNHFSERQSVSIFYTSVELFSKTSDNKTRDKIFYLMRENHPDNSSTYRIGSRLCGEGKIVVGKQIPEFSVQSLDNPDVTISSESLKGKYTLIDIWAVSCTPCRGEMEYLHAAYEKFKNKNFQMLSISFDKVAKAVELYRAKRWEMPWMNAFVEDGWNSKIKEAFEVYGIPRPVLIDPNGKILAVDGNL